MPLSRSPAIVLCGACTYEGSSSSGERGGAKLGRTGGFGIAIANAGQDTEITEGSLVDSLSVGVSHCSTFEPLRGMEHTVRDLRREFWPNLPPPRSRLSDKTPRLRNTRYRWQSEFYLSESLPQAIAFRKRGFSRPTAIPDADEGQNRRRNKDRLLVFHTPQEAPRQHAQPAT
jgi:hypothetical protein